VAIQKRLLVLGTTVGLLVGAAALLYSVGAQNGWLPEQEAVRYEEQTRSDIGLLAARSQVFAATLAIADSPVIGLGSWAVDKKAYARRFYEYINAEDQLAAFGDSSDEDWVPSHSHIMQAWVWHGIFGMLFWVVVLVAIYKYLRDAVLLCRPLVAYGLLLSVTGVWDLLFSPFSNRPRWGLLLAMASLSTYEVLRRRNSRAGRTPVDVEGPWDGKWRM